MNALHSLSIKIKLAIIITPLILALAYLAIVVVSEDYQSTEDLGRLENTISLSTNISNVVHELQRERGTTAGYLSSDGERFGNEIIIRRKATDKRLEEFEIEIQRVRSTDHAKEIEPFIERLEAAFGELGDFREKVDLFSITSNRGIEIVSNINSRVINVIREITQNTRNKEFFQKVNAYANYLFAKEQAGRERALLTSIFTLGKFDTKENYREFSALVAQQSNFLQNFTATAPTEWKNKFSVILERDRLDKDAFNKVSQIREVAFTSDTFNIDPTYWYDISTNKIDLLKEVEDFLTRRIDVESSQASQLAKNNFIYLIGIILLLGAVVLLLLSSIVGRMLRNVKTLATFSQKVSKGNLSETIIVKAEDEIGKFAKVFNTMVVNIRDTQNELKKEKNDAKFLYENTYKQSEVVFENVNQGIFLMDVKFNMSQLYSKEMEKIFMNDKIAGENFIQFMRPRLISRDQDALEMFVKHLFNPDIEEDVVNKLNPVEHVQIFSSNEDGELNSKYIKVAFSRVVNNDGSIQNILVTIIDETETILLQKEIEEAEGKNKQEMELMLSILKVDPIILEGFLTTCKQSLGDISHRYETDNRKNFKELISFTYNTIHNLKANAGLIELPALADSFHEIEELLAKLQGKDLMGDDFLKILFEINAANDTIEKMKSLLERILSVSHKNADKNGESHEKFTSILQNNTTKISSELGKKVEFQLEYSEDVSIPSKYKTDVKDILLQLIRNSVVHGIETPADRLKLNKLENGLIKVTIGEVNNRLSVHYFDDGQGLNLDNIMRKALADKIVSQDQVENLSSKDIAKLLFKDGFTTASEISQHAGRGQGMSLVGRIVKKFDGEMKLSFKKGKSFEMYFSFPLTHTMESIQSVA